MFCFCSLTFEYGGQIHYKRHTFWTSLKKQSCVCRFQNLRYVCRDYIILQCCSKMNPCYIFKVYMIFFKLIFMLELLHLSSENYLNDSTCLERMNTTDICSQIQNTLPINRIGDLMAIELPTNGVDRGCEQPSGQTKDHKFSGACCFSEKQATRKSTSKDQLAWNPNNMF